MDPAEIGKLETSDRKRLTATEDSLFLLKLLCARKSTWRFCTTMMDAESGARFCLAECREGHFFQPFTGESVAISGTWVLKERVRYGKVASRFFMMGYGLRRSLRLDYGTERTVRVRGLTVFHDGKPRLLRHFYITRLLKYPLGWHKDSLLEPRESYIKRASRQLDAASLEEQQHPNFCPIDGAVEPLDVQLRSPDWTWDQLCGRQWTAQVCPKCLFEFRRELTLMN